MTTEPAPRPRPGVSEGRAAVIPEPADRVILHVDMDSFFASVEVLDDPSLAGKAVIVGGNGRRGVVAACTYEARMFGVHSAMPSSVARRLCPHAIFLDGRFHRYVEESRRLHAILGSFTPLVEGISLDEAFLDVSGAVNLFGDGPTMGHAIRSRVRDEMRLECAVGVGRSKLMAKLASKAAKPRATRSGIEPGPGVVEVPGDGELAFLHPMPVRALWGIGPATEKRLLALGVTTVGELAAVPPEALVRYLGAASGQHLSNLSRAIDDRPVVPDQEAKSIGHEETFSTDVWELVELQRRLARMVDASATALRRAERAARTVTVKLRFGDFTQITRSHTLDGPVDATPAIAAVASALLDTVDLARGVRLLGVSLSGLADPGGGTQLRLDLETVGEGAGVNGAPGVADRSTSRASERSTERSTARSADRSTERSADRSTGPAASRAASSPVAPVGVDPPTGVRAPAEVLQDAGREAERLQATWGSVTDAIDAIRARYGGEAVGPASLVTPDGLRVRKRGDAQWGPTRPERSDDP